MFPAGESRLPAAIDPGGGHSSPPRFPIPRLKRGFIPGFAQLPSKPRGVLPSKEGAGFPGLSSCYLHLDTQRVQRQELAVGYTGFHGAWALFETNKFYKSGLTLLKMLRILQSPLSSASVRAER